jgi:hypothetical protein
LLFEENTERLLQSSHAGLPHLHRIDGHIIIGGRLHTRFFIRSTPPSIIFSSSKPNFDCD